MVCISVSAFAQEETSWTDGFSLSGSVDAYFRQNLNAPNKLIDTDVDGEVDSYIAPGSSFANQPGFALGMANLIIGYEKGNVGVVADLVYGPRGTDAVFGSTTASSSIVNQLYEVISPAANFNYSTSYMFSYGPFSHSGLKADFTLDENWSAMVALMNSTDYTDYNPFGGYTAGAQLGYSAGSGSAFLNFLYGLWFLWCCIICTTRSQ